MAGWRLEDIDDNLAADFDGSLSGLGVDLSVASYNMRYSFIIFIYLMTGRELEAVRGGEGYKLRKQYNTKDLFVIGSWNFYSCWT